MGKKLENVYEGYVCKKHGAQIPYVYRRKEGKKGGGKIQRTCPICVKGVARRRLASRNKEEIAAGKLKEKARRGKERVKVIAAYGGFCACCGITESKFLTIDHINDDGAAMRKKIKGHSNIYAWLIKNNFPKNNFQLLCWNCNLGKYHWGTCPHGDLDRRPLHSRP